MRNKVDGKMVGLSAAKALAVGLIANGFVSGIRVAQEYGETRQDLDFDKQSLNCTKPITHEFDTFKLNFALYWAVLGMGFTLSFVLILTQSIMDRSKENEAIRLPEERSPDSTNSNYNAIS